MAQPVVGGRVCFDETWMQSLPDVIQLVCMCAAVGLYAFLGLLMDGPASLASSLIGLKIAPHFDKPFLSSSVTDFWSRRWNLTAGNALRFLVMPSPRCSGQELSHLHNLPVFFSFPFSSATFCFRSMIPSRRGAL